MATPSAILNVLLRADTADATAKLSKYDKQLAAVDAKTRKGIETRLGATYNPKAFEQYTAALDKAAARTKSRDAFKAELGANFNNRAFNQYQRALEKANAETEASTVKNAKFGSALSGLGTVAKTAAIGVAAVGAGAAVIGDKSIKAAASFQQAMEMIHTQAHASQEQVDALSKSVEALAPATATGPDQLADGLYHLISQGLKPGAKAMDALRVAAEGAKIGNADLVDVTNALGAVVASGVKGTSNLDKAMASLNATVGAGDMHMQDLAEAFGTGLLGPMKRFGVNLQDINAALAVFGDNNIRGADAGTKLSSAIRIMAAPSNAAAKVLGGIGLSATQLADDIRSGPGGLLKALEDLKQKLEDSGKTSSEQARIITQAFGGKQSTGVQLLLGELEKLRQKEEAVGGGALSLKSSWDATQKTLQVQLDRLKITFETLGITIGNALAPVVPYLVKGAQAFQGFVQQMINGTGEGGKLVAVLKDAGSFVMNLFNQFQRGNPLIVSIVGGLAGMVVGLKAAAVAMAALDAVMAANPLVLLVAAIGAVVGALIVLNAKNKAVHDFMVAAWNDIKGVANAVFPTISTIVKVMVAITKIQFDLLKAYAIAVFTVIADLVKVTLIPAFNLIRPVLEKLGSLFKTVWGGIKDAIKTAMDFILSAFADFLHVAADIANVKLPFLGKVFGKTGDAIESAANNVDNLKNQLDGLPAKKGTEVDVKVNFVSNVAGAIASIGASVAKGLGNVGNLSNSNIGRRAIGGMVDQPMIMVGEEAPQHPEVILASNPAYRQRNLALWAQAGRMLGVPGFAQGGIPSLASAAGIVHEVDPWTASTAGKWMKGKAGAWAGNLMGQLGVGANGAPSGAGGPVPPGTARDWLTTALKLTNHFSPANLSALYSRMMQESGGNPNAINLWDSNAKAGHPSKGLLQTIDSTFNQYAIPGLGNIWNPIANAVAAIRYMFARYGHIVGASSTGYAKGGILGKIRGFAKGGFPQPKYEGALQKKFADTTKFLQGMWSTVAPYYHRGANSKMPGVTYTKGNDGLFVGVAGMGGGPGNRQFFLPDWVVQGKHGLANLDPSMVALMMHEWAHEFQRNDIINKIQRKVDPTANKINVAEGGAQSFTEMLAPTVLGRLGIPFKRNQVIDPPGAPYYPYTHWVENNLGRNWIMNKQFGFAKGGIVGRGLGKIRRFARGGSTGALPSASSIIGLPALPQVGGSGGNNYTPLWGMIAGARGTSSTISGDRGQIAALEQDFNSIDSFFNLSQFNFVDPNTGLRNEHDIAARIKQLDTLIQYRQKIFGLWGFVVALTQRLIAANAAIVKRLKDSLSKMSTKGLKGNALKSVQKHIQDTKTAIAKYTGNETSARGDLTTAIGDRQSAWISLQGLLGEKFSVAGTVGQAVAGTGNVDTTGGSTGSVVGPSDQSAGLLQSLLQQSQQSFAVSQAQYSVLQKFPAFGGSFAQGGVVPGPIGQSRTIIAHGGETVTPHGGHSVRVELHDHRTRVFVNDVEQVVQSSGRRDARNASRNLAGSRRRIGGL